MDGAFIRMDISGLIFVSWNAHEEEGEGAASGDRKEDSVNRASAFICAATESSKSYMIVSGERDRDLRSIFCEVAGTEDIVRFYDYLSEEHPSANGNQEGLSTIEKRSAQHGGRRHGED